jgi:predicted DNA-binding transcriptional regulator AlpA
MSGPALSAEDVAEELNRSVSWLYVNWRGLVSDHQMPPPLLNGQSPLSWSRAQIYAWLDRDLPKDMKQAAAAYRAAAAAAANIRHTPRSALQDAEDQAALDRRYVK